MFKINLFQKVVPAHTVGLKLWKPLTFSVTPSPNRDLCFMQRSIWSICFCPMFRLGSPAPHVLKRLLSDWNLEERALCWSTFKGIYGKVSVNTVEKKETLWPSLPPLPFHLHLRWKTGFLSSQSETFDAPLTGFPHTHQSHSVLLHSPWRSPWIRVCPG